MGKISITNPFDNVTKIASCFPDLIELNINKGRVENLDLTHHHQLRALNLSEIKYC